MGIFRAISQARANCPKLFRLALFAGSIAGGPLVFAHAGGVGVDRHSAKVYPLGYFPGQSVISVNSVGGRNALMGCGINISQKGLTIWRVWSFDLSRGECPGGWPVGGGKRYVYFMAGPLPAKFAAAHHLDTMDHAIIRLKTDGSWKFILPLGSGRNFTQAGFADDKKGVIAMRHNLVLMTRNGAKVTPQPPIIHGNDYIEMVRWIDSRRLLVASDAGRLILLKCRSNDTFKMLWNVRPFAIDQHYSFIGFDRQTGAWLDSGNYFLDIKLSDGSVIHQQHRGVVEKYLYAREISQGRIYGGMREAIFGDHAFFWRTRNGEITCWRISRKNIFKLMWHEQLSTPQAVLRDSSGKFAVAYRDPKNARRTLLAGLNIRSGKITPIKITLIAASPPPWQKPPKITDAQKRLFDKDLVLMPPEEMKHIFMEISKTRYPSLKARASAILGLMEAYIKAHPNLVPQNLSGTGHKAPDPK